MKTFILVFFVLFLLLLVNVCLMAQVTVQNNGIAFTSATGVFYIKGALNNASGASFTNNGSVYISGDVTNDQSSMSAGAGT
ncbi:MAG: hypothetical protein JST86_19525, partial [Bacteroidetes bacterium]|nr:hypothetical protein [Bacteroidota bacterium]